MASSSSAKKERMIVLRSRDGKEFEVEEAAVRQSNLLGDIFACCPQNDVHIPNVDGAILAKVIQYCKKHAATTALGDDDDDAAKRDDDMEAWDAAYIDVDQAILFDVLQAAHFLDIKSLYDLACQKVANMIKGKSVEEIRRTFNIKNDLTPEEEAEVRKQFQWAFD